MTCFNFRSTPMKAYQTFFFRPAYVGMCSHTACMRSRRLGTKPKRGSRYNSSLVFVFLCWRVQCYKAAYAERKATAFLPLSTGHVSFLQVRGREREEESTCKALKKVKKKKKSRLERRGRQRRWKINIHVEVGASKWPPWRCPVLPSYWTQQFTG